MLHKVVQNGAGAEGEEFGKLLNCPVIPAEAAEQVQAALFEAEARFTQFATEVFQKFDKDGNGFIDAGELAVVSAELGKPLSPEEVVELLREMDANQDGKVSSDELMVYFRRNRSRGVFAKKMAGIAATISRSARQFLPNLDLSTPDVVSTKASIQIGAGEWESNISAAIKLILGASECKAQCITKCQVPEGQQRVFAVIKHKLAAGVEAAGVLV